MNRKLWSALATVALSLCAVAAKADAPTTQPSGPYTLAGSIKIGGAGGWDYMAFDPVTKVLYVTRATHTQVIDPASGKVLADFPDMVRAHGTTIDQALGRGYISDGKDSSVTIFDLKTYQVLGKIAAAPDVDCILYDPASDHVLGVCGDSQCIIPIPANIDPKSGKADPKVDLDGAPEYGVVDGKGKAWINIADKDEVQEVDTMAMKVINTWPVAPGGQPTGMSMDPVKRVLYIGCRKPQKMIVMDADSGKILASLDIGATVDATRFDRAYGFASCADGTLSVVSETSPEQYAVVQVLKTAQGARTMTVDPDTGTIYLPTAEYPPGATGKKAKTIPDSFKILVVKPVNPG